jgi:serine/threonine protein kinase
MSSTNETIVGRYRLESRLGVGGMSTVMLAFDERLERYVAVKLLAEHLADDPTFVSRFRREALSAARLIHPNIVQVFDFGLDRSSQQHFIVMEHVSGHSCAELLRDRGHLDVDQAVEIISQACRGLDYAHRGGVVHRDVKPGNLLVSETEVVKLADFGIARAVDQSSITQVGSVLGTAAYLAPEQARGEHIGPRADLYSLGVVTYQLLSGRLPYEAASLSELALKQQREAPVPLGRLNPLVSPELADAVALALDTDPEGRPADAIEFGELIRDGANGISPFADEDPTRRDGSGALTRVIGGAGAETAVTRITPRVTPKPDPHLPPPTGVQQAVRPLPLRTVPTARRQDPYDESPPARRGGRTSRFLRRLVVVALMLIVVGIVVAGVVVYLADQAHQSVVHYEQLVAHDAHGELHQLQQLIDKYTK